jgi:hypothetical protein
MVCFLAKHESFDKIFLLDKTSPIWEKYEQDELTRISSIPPRNAFEEMIQWTKDGILWKFPIDNEQGEWIRHRII